MATNIAINAPKESTTLEALLEMHSSWMENSYEASVVEPAFLTVQDAVLGHRKLVVDVSVVHEESEKLCPTQ